MYYIYGKHSVNEALKNPKRKIKQIISGEKNELTKLCDSPYHQGSVLKVDQLYFSWDFSDIARKNIKKIIILNKLNNSENLGNIFRTCACFNWEYIIVITGNRSCAINSASIKIASGGIEHIKILEAVNLANTIQNLKKYFFTIIGTSNEGESINKIKENIKNIDKYAIIIGGEEDGIEPSNLKKCDYICSLNTNKNFSILNASISCSICTFFFNN